MSATSVQNERVIKLSEVLGPGFYDLARDVFDHGHTHYDLSGGRGSLKSSAVSLLVPLLLILHPDAHALVLRKVANTIRDSVYAQYIWALDKLGMSEAWEARVAPMELVYRPTGQKILFRGADDPMKLKSVKVPFGYIAVTHFEEKDQFDGREEIRSVLQSTMRGGEKFWNFESYNPPRSRDHWANQDSAQERPDRLCHRSTYIQAPPQWLGDAFLEEAEHLHKTNVQAWLHEYMGQCVADGAAVFENLRQETITQEQIQSFDRIYQGVDWGWYPDLFAFVRVHYDQARETVYVLDEICGNKLSNAVTAKRIQERGYMDVPVICDSAEPKSVGDYRAMGIDAHRARKGPGSVDYGMKWLQRRTIVIDKKRTPVAWREFSGYTYGKGRDGQPLSGWPDRNNHTIDAVRYALERRINAYGSVG